MARSTSAMAGKRAVTSMPFGGEEEPSRTPFHLVLYGPLLTVEPPAGKRGEHWQLFFVHFAA
jgi:hypothetical protein